MLFTSESDSSDVKGVSQTSFHVDFALFNSDNRTLHKTAENQLQIIIWQISPCLLSFLFLSHLQLPLNYRFF